MQLEMINAVSVSDYCSLRKGKCNGVMGANGHRYYMKFVSADRSNAAIKTMGALIAKACGLPTGQPVQIHMGPEVLRQIQDKADSDQVRQTYSTGIHFGSQHCGDLYRQILMDIATAPMIPRLKNREDVAVLRAVDVWTNNQISSRIVYVFDVKPSRDIVAHMIGFGGAFEFGGPRPVPIQRMVLDWPGAWDVTFAAIDRIMAISEDHLYEMANCIPAEWWRVAPMLPSEIVSSLMARKRTLGTELSATRLRESMVYIRAASGLRPYIGTQMRNWQDRQDASRQRRGPGTAQGIKAAMLKEA